MGERTGFLYPFLETAADDPAALLADLSRSASAKWDDSITLRRRTLAELDTSIARVASAMAGRIRAGGRIFVFGNGGSATDAAALVRLCATAAPRPLPAVSLVADPAVITALANDIGVDAVFARQLAAHGRGGDIAIAFSTSGGSTNVLAALDHGRSAGMLTVGLSGYGGGAMGSHVDHCLSVDSESVHRIQEAQVAIAAALVETTSRRLAEGSDR